MSEKSPETKKPDRRLGDEWVDWDGRLPESTEADYRVFLGMAVAATVLIILGATLFWWLIYPRLELLGAAVARIVTATVLTFCGALIIWLLLFVFSVVTRRPITRRLIIPQLVNRLLAIVLAIGRILGISRDRMTNSFMKVHNLFLGKKPVKTESERLLVLLPRCLTKDNNKQLRQMRDRYQIKMFTVGGGTEARKKIHEVRPKMIIAVACERDLLSGFKEVNTQIPVIGFPNHRPEGPCKNTCVDLDEIEQTIKNCLI